MTQEDAECTKVFLRDHSALRVKSISCTAKLRITGNAYRSCRFTAVLLHYLSVQWYNILRAVTEYDVTGNPRKC